MKALVTGGAGFIGSNLVEALVDDYEVTILDSLHTGSMENLKSVQKDVKFIKGSCNNCLDLGQPHDIIFHLGIPSSSPMYKKDPFLVGEAVNGMIAIMELARRSSTKKVVFASSSSVYNGVLIPHKEDATILVTDYYTEARLAIERIAELYHQLYGINYAGLRFFSVYGPHEKAKKSYANMITQFLWTMKEGKAPVIYGNGEQTRDFTYVKDIVDALILTSRRGSGIYNAGTGRAYSFNQIIDLLNDKLGTDIKSEYLPNPIKNYVMHTLADTHKIADLGFYPKYTLSEGMDELLNECM